MTYIYMGSILVYLFILVFVAFSQMRKVRTQADFAVAGRSLTPWILVLTMLATWIGTGSILGNAGKAYAAGISAAILALGGTIGLILLTFIAPKVRSYEKFSVPEIIEARYGHFARILGVFSLVAAYLVIVSYQFNAGGGVLQVVMGKKAPVAVQAGGELSDYQFRKGYVSYKPVADFSGTVELVFDGYKEGLWHNAVKKYTIRFVPVQDVIEENISIHENQIPNIIAAATGVSVVKIKLEGPGDFSAYKPAGQAAAGAAGGIVLIEPVLSMQKATIIAAAFIIAFTMIAGLVSVAYVDIGNGSIIIFAMLIAFPYLLIKAGGLAGMTERFAAMGKPENMDFFSGLTWFKVANLCLPGFLLILGDANMYQRFFASKSAKGARQATFVLIFLVTAIELLIIGSGWVAGSLIPDAQEGRYVMIVAARQLMPPVLGCIMLVNIVAIIMSTADSFLLVPSNSLIRDVYMAYINPRASEKHVVFMSRLFVLLMGIIAYLISLTFERSPGFLERALYAYTIYGTSITPSLVAALYWKRATTAGAVSSIVAGTVVTLTWKNVVLLCKSIGFIGEKYYTQLDEALPAITASVAALVIVSLLTQKKPVSAPPVRR